ncbi:MAG: hypothetical protein ACPGMR_03425 [Pontibacterium sp.]
MRVTDRTRKALKARKERRELEKQGYRKHETDWEIHRGNKRDQKIIDAKVSICGKYVYTKLGEK